MAAATSSPDAQRRDLVRLLAARGVSGAAVLDAMASVPREAFVAEGLADRAYADSPLPIGGGQTISQPQMVAVMTEALELRPSDRVLEVGTGSGYAAAVLARVAGEVHTVERDARLATTARDRLKRPGYENVAVRHGDGSEGWPGHAPYDAVVVTAAPARLPPALLSQVAVGGRLVAPVGPQGGDQSLVRVRRLGEDEYTEEDLGPVRFVPLT
ncbi:MAG: protein-L-isoaspartate(D-aspartate) O-methyltransferase [Actinomycetes bacterium]